MRVGEKGVPTVEQWLEQEAAGVRDDAAAANGGGCEDGEGGEGSAGEFRLGVDPWLLSAGTARSLTAKLAESGGRLVKIVG